MLGGGGCKRCIIRQVLTVYIIWVILQNFFVEFLCFVKLTKHFMKASSVVLDGDRYGGVVLQVLFTLTLTSLPCLTKIFLSLLIITQPVGGK